MHIVRIVSTSLKSLMLSRMQALINNQFNDHWIYWAGPAVASVCTVVLQYILYGTASAEVIEDEDEVAQTSKPSGVPVV